MIDDMYREGNIIWCTSREDAWLYRIDLNEGIADEVCRLLDYDIKRAFCNIAAYKESLVFIPGMADEVVIWEKETGKIKRYAIPFYDNEIAKNGIKFFRGIIFGDDMFLFGYSFPGILKLDLITGESHVIGDWLRGMEFTNGADGCFHVRYFRQGNKIFFPFMNANAVMEFDMESCRAAVHKVGDERQRYISIEHDGQCFWLVPRDGSVGSVVRWNPVSGETDYFDQYPEGFGYQKMAFYQTANIDGQMLLFAHGADMNIRVDFLTGRMCTFPDAYDTSDVRGCKYPLIEKEDDEIFILTGNEALWWNPANEKTTRSIPFKLSDRVVNRRKVLRLSEMFATPEGGSRLFRESKNCGRDDFVDYVTLRGKA